MDKSNSPLKKLTIPKLPNAPVKPTVPVHLSQEESSPQIVLPQSIIQPSSKPQATGLQSPVEIRQSINRNTAHHETIDLNEPWNMMIKRYLKRIGEQAQGYHWAHEQEKVFYEQLDKKLRIVNVIFVAVITTLNTSNVMALVSKQQSYVLLLVISLVVLVVNIAQVIITGMLELGNYQQKIFDHKWNSVKFNEIHSDILTQFSLPVDKREKDDDYMRNKTKEFSDTLTTNPPIRPATFKRYERATEQEDIFKPIVVGGFDKIEIVIDSGETTSPVNGGSEATCQEVRHGLEKKINLELDRFLKLGEPKVPP